MLAEEVSLPVQSKEQLQASDKKQNSQLWMAAAISSLLRIQLFKNSIEVRS